jgi:hypothetical protein
VNLIKEVWSGGEVLRCLGGNVEDIKNKDNFLLCGDV